MKDFGETLRQLRKQAGLSQATLGHVVGHNQTTISEYERGSRTPGWFDTQRLEKALQVADGTLGSVLGFTAPAVSVAEAIAQDTKLGHSEKELLTRLYKKLCTST